MSLQFKPIFNYTRSIDHHFVAQGSTEVVFGIRPKLGGRIDSDGAVVRSLACRAKVPGFKSRQNLSGPPVSLFSDF